MTGRINEIEDILLAVGVAIVETNRLCFDRDASFPFDIHRVEYLFTHVSRRDRAGSLNQSVGERRLAVIDMSNDRKIADVIDGQHEHGAPDWANDGTSGIVPALGGLLSFLPFPTFLWF